MLEKPGSVIPLENLAKGAATSKFSVFAVTQVQMLTLDGPSLRGVLACFPKEDSVVITDALSAEYKSLTDSLKMNRDAASLRESKSDDTPSEPNAAGMAVGRPNVPERVVLTEKVRLGDGFEPR